MYIFLIFEYLISKATFRNNQLWFSTELAELLDINKEFIMNLRCFLLLKCIYYFANKIHSMQRYASNDKTRKIN